MSQATRIVQAVDEAVVAAENAQDVAALDPRGAEPYTTMASARFTLARGGPPTVASSPTPSATASPTSSPTPSPSQSPSQSSTSSSGATASTAPGPLTLTRLFLPRHAGWPRFFVAVGSRPGQPTPVIRLLRSADAGSPYALSMEMPIFPGATLPSAEAAASAGVPLVEPTETSRGPAPLDVLTQYADVLTTGSASSYAQTFTDDVYRAQILARPAQDAAQMGSVATVTSTHTAVPESVAAVGLQGGNTLVLGQLTQTYTITVRPGAGTVSAPPGFAALAGRSTFTQNLVRTSVQVVAFVVPPAGQVTAIAAQRADISVTGS